MGLVQRQHWVGRMTYRCTNPACGRRGPRSEVFDHFDGTSKRYWLCPECLCNAEDLDFLERAAIREIDGGLPREDAERLAREDMEKVVEEDGPQ